MCRSANHPLGAYRCPSRRKQDKARATAKIEKQVVAQEQAKKQARAAEVARETQALLAQNTKTRATTKPRGADLANQLEGKTAQPVGTSTSSLTPKSEKTWKCDGTCTPKNPCPQCTYMAVTATVETQTDVPDLTVWEGSPFRFILDLPPRGRGAVGEAIAEAWLTKMGMTVGPPESSDHDRIVNGHKVEVKTSTLWRNGHYAFQQIRDQDYDTVVLQGLSPDHADTWVVPKDVLMAYAVGQHGGAAGNDTSWLKFPADDPPEWLAKYGGSVAKAQQVARRLLKSQAVTANV